MTNWTHSYFEVYKAVNALVFICFVISVVKFYYNVWDCKENILMEGIIKFVSNTKYNFLELFQTSFKKSNKTFMK